jgi:hypothetical protein
VDVLNHGATNMLDLDSFEVSFKRHFS